MVSLPEWDCVSLNSELCSGLHKYRDAFWPRRSQAAYVLRIPSACSSSCRLCCTCERARAAALTSWVLQHHSIPVTQLERGGTQTRTKMHQQCPQVTLGTATFHISKERQVP